MTCPRGRKHLLTLRGLINDGAFEGVIASRLRVTWDIELKVMAGAPIGSMGAHLTGRSFEE
jgi:hypothetical protein